MSVIVPDVNVLVYAFRADTPLHQTYAEWLNREVREGALGLADPLLSGFLRIVTHPAIMEVPASLEAAVEFTSALAAAPRAVWLTVGPPVWDAFDRLATDDPGIRANLVPDAYLAALCVSNGARLATRDRGFARYPGLDWFDPARS